MTREEHSQFFDPSELQEEGREVTGFITHCKGDGIFYLMLNEETEAVAEIVRQMNVVYINGSSSSHGYRMHLPRVNQACGVVLDGGGGVARGQVVDMSGFASAQSVVEVLLVDSGKRVHCQVDQLRLLPFQFMNKAVQSVSVSLHGVKDVKEAAAEVLEGREVIAYVESSERGVAGSHVVRKVNHSICFLKLNRSSDPSLLESADLYFGSGNRFETSDNFYFQVTLYEDTPEKCVCLNALVISKGLGASSDPAKDLRQVTYYKRDPEELVREGLGHLVHSCCIVPIDEDEYSPCQVLSANGPDLLFVTTSPERAEDTRKMEQAMFTKYGAKTRTPGGEETWAMGEPCCVAFDGHFKRGIVFALPQKDQEEDEEEAQYTVHLVDEGRKVL